MWAIFHLVTSQFDLFEQIVNSFYTLLELMVFQVFTP